MSWVAICDRCGLLGDQLRERDARAAVIAHIEMTSGHPAFADQLVKVSCAELDRAIDRRERLVEQWAELERRVSPRGGAG
jgi:hypothetical protein